MSKIRVYDLRIGDVVVGQDGARRTVVSWPCYCYGDTMDMRVQTDGRTIHAHQDTLVTIEDK